MTIALLAVLLGFVALVWSADQFVTGAASTARYLGMSPLMIGLTVVAFGTSAPEIFVSLNASMSNAGDMAVGNALGSNLANVGLVLAIAAFIVPLPIAPGLLRRELPILAFITLLAGYALHDYQLDMLDGCLLLASLLLGGYISVRGQKSDAAKGLLPVEEPDDETLPAGKAWLYLIGGLLVLVASSNLLVWGAKEAAHLLGVSQLIIGLTLVAVGTSLPELAAAVASALRGHVDIALGNVVGSNIFNIAAVMAIPGLLGGVQLAPEIMSRDYLFTAGITFILMLVIAIDHFRRRSNLRRETAQAGAEHVMQDTSANWPKIGRIAAVVFLAIYITYYVLLFSTTS